MSAQASLAICAELAQKLEEDCFIELSEGVDTESDTSQPRSTVGLLLNGAYVDDVIVGGPAFNTEQIEKGDTIVRVDNVEVTAENVQRALIGTDRPESTVTVTIKKGASSILRKGDSNPLWYLNSAISSTSPLPAALQDHADSDAMTRDVVVTRMRSANVADRKRISELLTIMKVRPLVRPRSGRIEPAPRRRTR